MDETVQDRVTTLLKPKLEATRNKCILDILGDEQPAKPVGRIFQNGIVSSIYEHWWRPAFGRIAKGVLGPSMSDEREIAHLLLALAPGDKVLDIACGTGRFTRHFAEVVGDSGLAIGLDPSLPMLERAVRRAARGVSNNVAFVRASAQDLPFKQESFNAVCCFAALHLFPEPYVALDQMRSILAPGGRIALFTTTRSRTATLRTSEQLLTRHSGVYMFEESEVRTALEQRGFKDIRQRVSGFTQFIGGRLP